MPDRTLPKTDVVIVGGGWTGLTAAYELCHEGLRCVVLERGRFRHDAPDFSAPQEHDELRYAIRAEHMMEVKRQSLTFRNNRDERALPMRRLGSFLPGSGLGGAGIHWNGQIWRPLPSDLAMRSHYEDRYGAGFIPEELTVQDYGVSYDELRPHFEMFEAVCGASGQAANLDGETRPGGNPFEGPRDPYPNPPMKQHYGGALFEAAAKEYGANPFPMPSANVTREYVNPYGATLHPCVYCGFCERFGCGYFAKADPIICVYDPIKDHPNFTLRTESYVMRVEKSEDGRTATGVTYVDRDGVETFQPADMVLLCAYSLWNVHLMLCSGLGEPYDPATNTGTVGRNYSYQTIGGVDAFLDEGAESTDPFMGAGALGTCVDDFNGDNFDHGPLGFVGGGYIACTQYHGRPISYQPTPSGTPTWGAEWKQAVRTWYSRHAGIVMHGSSMPTRGNYLDLDPTWTDEFGRPLLRMTFDFPDNDRRMAAYVTERAAEIARLMPHAAHVDSSNRAGSDKHYSVVPYQTTHNVGGAVIGTDPRTSVVNRYGQMWDLHNVFNFGASLFPQNYGYNPTGMLMGLCYWTLAAIKRDYLPNPRPLSDA